MFKIILITAAWVLFLTGTSFLFVWLGERAQNRAREKQRKKFQYFDKYYSELEKKSEKELENKRQERMTVLGYVSQEADQQGEDIDLTHLSGSAV